MRISDWSSDVCSSDLKQEMAERTLAMRAKSLHMANVKEYLDHLEMNSQSPQWETFVNAFTINHTAFFREQHHFAILAKFAKTRKKPFSLWCAALSTGEEPYSLAMHLAAPIPAPNNGLSLFTTTKTRTAPVRES